MGIEDYILNGDCDGCDMDPTTCLHSNCCYYESKKSSYNFHPGEEVFIVKKANNNETYIDILVVKRIIDCIKEDRVYWLKDVLGNASGFCKEEDLFHTKQEALESALKRVF